MHSKTLDFLGKRFTVSGDGEYLDAMGDRFEPETVSLLSALSDSDSQVLDVGANIGLTALTLSQICQQGKIVALEPVPHTYELLVRNISAAGVGNVKCFNFGAGSQAGSFTMQGAKSNLSGAFVADKYQVPAEDHFWTTVEIKRLDDVFQELGLQKLDFLKIDVEGFELQVLKGAKETLKRFKPRVMLEMNHWCLNVMHRITLPEFRDELLKIFPFVFAVQLPSFRDFGDDDNVHHIFYHHLLEMQFMNIVAGFDREDLVSRLQTLAVLNATVPSRSAQMAELTARLSAIETDDANIRLRLASRDAQVEELSARANECQSKLDAVLHSRSWRITEPLRSLRKRRAKPSE